MRLKGQRFTSHEAYIDAAPLAVRGALRAIQSSIEAKLPEAERCISYNIPAYRMGRVFFYFAAFRAHIGVYPPVVGSAALQRDLARYRGPKGNLSFPLSEPLPIKLIERVAVALARERGRG